jgi:hypothetical protein
MFKSHPIRRRPECGKVPPSELIRPGKVSLVRGFYKGRTSAKFCRTFAQSRILPDANRYNFPIYQEFGPEIFLKPAAKFIPTQDKTPAHGDAIMKHRVSLLHCVAEVERGLGSLQAIAALLAPEGCAADTKRGGGLSDIAIIGA